MYRRILIANRADCALRLIRACHEENIEAIVIAARDDALELVKNEADRVIYTGMSREGYISQENILEAARQTLCEAILPGWGFLSESFDFARRARLMGIHVIGPSSKHLQIFGDKLKTLDLFCDITESRYISCDAPDFEKRLFDISMPCMLKYRFGGAGKNIEYIDEHRVLVQRLEKLSHNCELSQYYIEPAVTGARHIEFQFLGDGHGQVLCLGARDCTAQKNNQKWLEFTYDLTASARLNALSESLTRRLAQIQYAGWATVEFLVSGDGSLHLLEVNPRLQVEHGITEMATGIDIVRSAIRTSCGDRLEIVQSSSVLSNSSEFRLFARSTGAIRNIGFETCSWPHHPCESNSDYRLETAYRAGDIISGVYDGMLARFIVRDAADPISKLKNWLSGFLIEGVENNLSDLKNI